MNIYDVEVSTLTSIIKRDGDYILDIDDEDKSIIKCIKIGNLMVDLKTGKYYEIITTDFTYVIDESYINNLNADTFYALRYELTDLKNEPHAFYYKEKAKNYEKYLSKLEVEKTKPKNNILIFKRK